MGKQSATRTAAINAQPSPNSAGILTPAAPEDEGGVGVLYCLRLRNYRLLWLGGFFSGTSIWVQSTTMGWVAYDLTGSATILGTIGLMRALPTLLLAPLAGVIADRVDRRRFLAGVQMLQALVAAGMAVGLMLDRVVLWHLFAFSFLGGAFQTFHMPMQQSLVFDIVPRRAIPNAIALSSTAFNVTQVFGPSAAGFLIAAFGPDGNFFVQSAAYLGVVFSLLSMRIPRRRSAPGPTRLSFLRNLKDGIGYAAKEKTLRVLMLLGVLQTLLLVPVTFSLMPVFAKNTFHSGPQGLGLLMSAIGVGGLLGAFTTAWLGGFERRGLLQLGALAVSGVALLAFSFARSLPTALPLLALTGFCQLVFMNANQTILQLIVPDEMRGRILGLFAINMAMFPIGGLIAGALADSVGAPATAAIASGLAVAMAAGMFVFAPRMRELRTSRLM